MAFVKTQLVLTFFCILRVAAGTKCGKANGKYDFSELKNLNMSIMQDGYNYTIDLCGLSPRKCPKDPDGVVEGMATQYSPQRCYVLGQYDNTVAWEEGDETATLTTGNGSPADCPLGLPRKLSVTLMCDPKQTKKDLPETTFSVSSSGCSIQVAVPTCLACNKGCSDPKPSPSPSADHCCYYDDKKSDPDCQKGAVCCRSHCKDPLTCSFSKFGCSIWYGQKHNCEWNYKKRICEVGTHHLQNPYFEH